MVGWSLGSAVDFNEGRSASLATFFHHYKDTKKNLITSTFGALFLTPGVDCFRGNLKEGVKYILVRI